MKIWEYLNKFPDGLPENGKLMAIYCYDSYALKYIRDSFKTEKMHEEKLNILLGSEVSSTWVDDNFKSLGLFGNNESFFIHAADEIQETVLEVLQMPEDLILSGRYLILNFHKDTKAFKKLQKSSSELIETIQITAPAFWEEMQLLDFLCQNKQLTLSREIKEKIKNQLPFDISSYSRFLDQLLLNFPGKEMISDADAAMSLSSESKVDQFEILELFATKKMRLFYQQFLEAIESGNEIIPMLYLIQGHFIKLYDTSYLEAKTKLTKYDRGIQAQSKLWSHEDIFKVVDYFGELLILAKQKSDTLELRIKHDQMRLIKF
jgi:DNA polymerase III delta subunit